MRKTTRQWLGSLFALLAGISALLLSGTSAVRLLSGTSVVRLAAQAPPTLVIDGGTLIDGNGGAPVADAVVVIQGDRITSVSRRGQAAIPANAQVIRADGKFILPGLWDSQVSYNWYYGEVMLNYGITSTIDVGIAGEIGAPHRDGVHKGRIRGPRPFSGLSRISSEPVGNTGLETTLTPGRTGAVRERRLQGYRNALRFHKMFSDAGGRLIPGANTNPGRVPGNSLIHEMVIFTEVKGESELNPPVEALLWVNAFRPVVYGGSGGRFNGNRPSGAGQPLPNPAESPQPALEAISPLMVTEGSPTTTITLKGFNFVRRSQVLFKGIPVPYKAVSGSELQVTIDASLLHEPGWHDVVVRNPWPLHPEIGLQWGNGTSNKAHLIVKYRD